ncbi:dihydrolipoyl dehydrogenase [Salipiger abyssi]|uniref:dihydrolipoyl dehydrogenase n=1 Tax=Salipiger abyssi TaxID=1250539 RepID=UPI0040597E99
MNTLNCKVLVIGGGPGGYVCAVRAGQAGLDTIVVEKARVGGTCLNVGCIPSKALIHVAEKHHVLTEAARGDSALGLSASAPGIDLSRTQVWKDGIVEGLTSGVAGLLRKAGVRQIEGTATIVDGKTVRVETDAEPVTIRCEALVLATGSVPADLPGLPFGGAVLSSTDALGLTERPETLAIVGGGYIGLEIGGAYAKLGTKVTVVEAAETILPQYDTALTKPVMARMKALGVAFELGVQAKAHDAEKAVLTVARGDEETGIAAEKVMVAVGRRPVIEGTGIESLSLDMEGRFIRIDTQCQTSMRGVYAIGDVTGDPMLAHRAFAQGEIVAKHLAGDSAHWDKRCIPAVCYTDPEIVTVGLLPDAARAAQETTATAVFPLQANGRALTLERKDGFVRVVYDKQNELVLGIQAVGAGCAEMAGEFALAIEMCATLTDIADTIHAHPTLGETLQEAALSGRGLALHI